MNSTILGKTGSSGCTKTWQKFKATGLNPDHQDATQGPQALAQLKGMGYSSAPVVIVAQNDDEISRWSGLNLKTYDAIAVEQEETR